MTLKELFDGIKYELIKGNMDTMISDIVYDSRKVKDGVLFMAIVGSQIDGHDFVSEAIKNGAKVIVVSKDIEIKEDVTVIKVKDTRKILSKLSLKLFKYPQSKLKTIAITGTKGKTTVSFMIKRILEVAGYKCGLIGTTGIFIGSKMYPAKNTTPESYETIKYMDEMVKKKMDYMVMEVSSQALKYDRVNDIIFDIGVFTNLSQDHIGPNEHDSMEDYISSKAKLFNQCNHGIFNIDDNHFYDMVSGGDASINTYGYDKRADLRVKDIKLVREKKFIGIDLTTDGVIKDTFRVSSPGKFSSYNALAAIMTCYMLGIDTKYMKEALEDFHVRGRVENVHVSDDFTLLIDYAHNGVSTESILSTIREYDPGRIVTIFGCGGNRSKDRRYEMGEMAGKYSDYCIITEDNNRYEEFDDIAKDILVGINKTKCEYTIIPDRKDAIKYAIENGRKGDIIMLIGKGHEDYKEIKGKRYHFDEREVIKEILEEIKKK
ncbi:MAG: UDP-N-acetylmuramoyl-L-alanyl-D-glutamate--2,6-diaminopimelate ligase [Bacilli bacterium]|nr:UDP-N-acetylmuramoyl-L-alanyl-D-glutamate--2,6-diaminopimelate ligase [Bacilli bacterium]